MNIAITTSYIVINNETTVNVFKDKLAGNWQEITWGSFKKGVTRGGRRGTQNSN